MTNISKRIGAAIIAVTVTTTFAAQMPSQTKLDTLATHCAYYLNRYHATNMPEKAAPALKQCYQYNSCVDSNLSGIPNCTRKLLLWEANYTPPQTKTAAKKKSTSTVTKPVAKMPPHPPIHQTILPITTAPQKAQPKPKKEKEPSINWF